MISLADQNKSNSNQICSQTYKIITQYGDMLVVKQGMQSSHHHHHHHHSQSHNQEQQQQSRPVIMTFHDLGLNSELQFATFCECDEVKLMLQTFHMIHVNFIGQEFSGDGQMQCNNLAPDYKYPSVEQMAECIVDVCAQLRVRSFIALAVGAGAHIVSLLALMRPDLVDGLFLINPIVTSCSITEWLYFKMSAIASSHHIGGSSAGSGSSADHHNQHQRNQSGASNSNSPINVSRSTTGNGGAAEAKGLRKLLNAAHIHLGHHHASGGGSTGGGGGLSNSSPPQTMDDNDEENPTATIAAAAAADDAAGGVGRKQANFEDDTMSIGQMSNQSSSSMASSSQVGGSRLRRLILSRNFRLGGGGSGSPGSGHQQKQKQQQQQRPVSGPPAAAAAAAASRAEPATLAKTSTMADQHNKQAAARSPGSIPRGSHHLERKSSRSSNVSIESRSSGTGSGGGAGKRPPLEYLMYHHFGPSSFQRYRRSSETTLAAADSLQSSAPCSSSSMAVGKAGDGSADNAHQSPVSSGGLRRNSPAGSSRSGRRAIRATSATRASTMSRSQESLMASSSQRARSGSVCMSATYLASFPSDRQRHNYMHGVYKHYFSQLNSHNLWLFAQSFAKRHTLNLRKDCGAAAHAAAAAAALGTSICTAFVGAAPDFSPSAASASSDQLGLRRAGDADNRAEARDSSQPEICKSASEVKQQQQQQQQQQQLQQQQKSSKPQRQQQQALVAGTKVKRTFTCQTLIMCSSVQLHCERAFKLMSLLNPLQATWIKCDQMLVLEEKPEKVCQALRLFLQGIGYSMSTYERRLRLVSSNTGSASSAESSGSAPSSSNEKG